MGLTARDNRLWLKAKAGLRLQGRVSKLGLKACGHGFKLEARAVG